MRPEPYSETRREHQEPIAPISQWQEWNDYQDSPRAIEREQRDMSRREKDYLETATQFPLAIPDFVPLEPEDRKALNAIRHRNLDAAGIPGVSGP